MDSTKLGRKAPSAADTRFLNLIRSNAPAAIPAGPRLNLMPIRDRFFVSSPDEGQEEKGKIGGIHLPENSTMQMSAYAEVEVLACGPDVSHVEPGDRVLIVRPQVEMIVYLGNKYYTTNEVAVVGIISRKVT